MKMNAGMQEFVQQTLSVKTNLVTTSVNVIMDTHAKKAAAANWSARVSELRYM